MADWLIGGLTLALTLTLPPDPPLAQVQLPLLLQVINHEVVQNSCKQLVEASWTPPLGSPEPSPSGAVP